MASVESEKEEKNEVVIIGFPVKGSVGFQGFGDMGFKKASHWLWVGRTEKPDVIF